MYWNFFSNIECFDNYLGVQYMFHDAHIFSIKAVYSCLILYCIKFLGVVIDHKLNWKEHI